MTTETEDRIDKGNVRFAHGYKLGASRGIRDDQDEAIEEFARRLAEEFPHKISIRYNTNRLGGGAWLVDGKRNAQVGLGCDVVTPEWFNQWRDTFLEWCWDYGLTIGDLPDFNRHFGVHERELAFSVKVNAPVFPEEMCNRNTDTERRHTYYHNRFDTLEEAWEFFLDHADRDAINPPPE